MQGSASERSASDSAASEVPVVVGNLQVMGSTQAVNFTGLRAGAQTRSNSRGRAGEIGSNRTPLSASARAGGIDPIWMEPQVDDGSASRSSDQQPAAVENSTAQMQVQFEEMRAFMREQAKKEAGLLALLGSMQLELAGFRAQAADQASKVPPQVPLGSFVSESAGVAPSSVPSSLPLDSAGNVSSNAGDEDLDGEGDEEEGSSPYQSKKIQFEDEDDQGANVDSEARGGRFSGRVPIGRVLSSGEDPDGGGMFRAAGANHAMEMSQITAYNRSSESFVKNLRVFSEVEFPLWRDSALEVFSLRGLTSVVLSEAGDRGASPALLVAKRQNAWLLLSNSLERAKKSRIITKSMDCNPAKLWTKLIETYALAPAYVTADAAKEVLEKLRQGAGPASLMAYLQTFESQFEQVQGLLVAANRNELEEVSIIATCYRGLNAPHKAVGLGMLDIHGWDQWRQSMRQRSFVAQLSNFSGSTTATGEGTGARNPNRGGEVERAFAAHDGGSTTCYGCGEPGHIRRDCSVPGIATRECHKCGKTGHIAKACKHGENLKGGAGAGAKGGARVSKKRIATTFSSSTRSKFCM